ncbi:MAG: hypothetical protein V2J26_01350 [Pacificimonas sp.]|jgi:MYXO-CTERM domain-containing protein|nr:hypothetical protein [Pacificimonas sp.]
MFRKFDRFSVSRSALLGACALGLALPASAMPLVGSARLFTFDFQITEEISDSGPPTFVPTYGPQVATVSGSLWLADRDRNGAFLDSAGSVVDNPGALSTIGNDEVEFLDLTVTTSSGSFVFSAGDIVAFAAPWVNSPVLIDGATRTTNVGDNGPDTTGYVPSLFLANGTGAQLVLGFTSVGETDPCDIVSVGGSGALAGPARCGAFFDPFSEATFSTIESVRMVPGPGAAGLAGLGLLGLAALRRRRNA